MAADILGRSAALCAMCSRPAYDPRSQYPLGRPWNLGPIGISAEIRWAVCHGYIAGKNGRMVWLCRLDGVSNDTSKTSDLVLNAIRNLYSLWMNLISLRMTDPPMVISIPCQKLR